MNSTVSKFIIGTFVVIIVYYLLVYYKGGASYVSGLSGAYNSGVGALMQSGTRSYATNG